MARPERPGMERDEPVQHAWPEFTCYGCGPANPDGIQLESYLAEDGESLVATVEPDARYTSGMENVAYGGYVASLVDCHSVWTAVTFAHRAEGRPLGEGPPISYVTGELSVTYHEPTPLSRDVELRAWVEGEVDRKTNVTCEVGSGGEPTATGEVTAVRVPDGSFDHRFE